MPVAERPVRRKIRYTRPPMYPRQRDAIFADERYSVVEASTKAGKTVGCIAWLFEQAMFGPDHSRQRACMTTPSAPWRWQWPTHEISRGV
jgi:hypothetical protein